MALPNSIDEIVDGLDEPRIAQERAEKLVLLLEPVDLDQGDNRRTLKECGQPLPRADEPLRTVRSSQSSFHPMVRIGTPQEGPRFQPPRSGQAQLRHQGDPQRAARGLRNVWLRPLNLAVRGPRRLITASGAEVSGWWGLNPGLRCTTAIP